MSFSNVTIDPEVRRVFPESHVGWLLAGVSVRENHPRIENKNIRYQAFIYRSDFIRDERSTLAERCHETTRQRAWE